MATQHSPFRRWKRFYRIFDTIDTAIVASQRDDEVGCAKELRQAKGDVVELLCIAPEDDPAEYLCRILDDIMVDYLITLKTVPVTSSVLASTDLAKAVRALHEGHESEKIRGLAGDIVGMWRASVESDLTGAKARLEELRKLSDDQDLAPKPKRRTSDDCEKKRQAKDAPCTTKTARVVRVEPDKRQGVSAPPLPKKGAPVAGLANTAANIKKTKLPTKTPAAAVVNGRSEHTGIDKMMEYTKRKLREGYQEVTDAKRLRKIQVIQAPKMLPQQSQQRKTHPIMRERDRSRAGCGVPMTAVRRSLMPAFDRMQ